MIPCIENSWSYASGADDVLVGPSQLHAHDGRLDAAGEEEERGRHQVANADPLVVDGGQPRQERRQCSLLANPDPRDVDGHQWRLSRYASRSWSWLPVRSFAGMWLPGLMCCGSRIQPAR